MKTVLMIAYHYPPEGSSSGVLRTLKFSKYLPRYRWIPHILTLHESFYVQRDAGLLQDVPPEAVIHRTFALDSARHLAVKGRHLALLSIPDRFISWLPFGLIRGLRVIGKAGINILYSTSPPPTAHLIAAALKAATGLPWVADFRDPWVEEGLYPPPGTLRYRVESALERLVVQRSDRVIVTTPYLRRDFLGRYSELAPGKIRVIYNGYDEDDFQSLDGAGRRHRFEIIHAGLVTPEFRDPMPLLKAVATLIADDLLPRHEVLITFMGGGPYLLSEAFTAGVKRLGLEGIVEVSDRVPHADALQRLRQAAVLLLLQASDDTRALIPAKAFEYLRLGRPILALTLEGATADLLKGMEHCQVVDPADLSGLRRAVVLCYRLWQGPSEGRQVSRPLWRYERRHLTAELAQLLEELMGEGSIQAAPTARPSDVAGSIDAKAAPKLG
jgi:glycosyltransferase involved in cell wall biosynthesis